MQVTEGSGPREQAALVSILYHTKQLEDKHGGGQYFELPAQPNFVDVSAMRAADIIKGKEPV